MTMTVKKASLFFNISDKAGINKLFGSGHFASLKEGLADGR